MRMIPTDWGRPKNAKHLAAKILGILASLPLSQLDTTRMITKIRCSRTSVELAGVSYSSGIAAGNGKVEEFPQACKRFSEILGSAFGAIDPSHAVAELLTVR
jgi:hypothetical protein